ncbi:hypothetical protein [Luteolibacter marinus]|uniref:hypothetical protein n=1 Tax=Luteolibacter marinus TaxID=2776705 RepID=UPI0018665EB0|nr:hypothetical protein [Luteolibacter marinus]
MKFRAACLLFALPAVVSELASRAWMDPATADRSVPLLDLRVPDGPDKWMLHPDQYREVQPSLHCDAGWIAQSDGEEKAGMRIAWFQWDGAETVNTLEAFKHLPEQCMGSIGMRLEKIHPRRRLEIDGHTLVFDSTQFRPRGGGQVMNVFKCVWVSGLDGADLRGDILLGGTGHDLRRLRFAAALTRFKPAHTRVIMGSVAGLPSEDLAWHQLSASLRQGLHWQLANSP